MTSREKRFEKIITGKAKVYAFEDIRNFLEHYGFKASKARSSHFIFRRKSYPHITIVTHKQNVKAVYVKRMVQILRDYHIL